MVSLPPPQDEDPTADVLEVLFDIDGGKFTYNLIDIVLAHVERENQELGMIGYVINCSSFVILLSLSSYFLLIFKLLIYKFEQNWKYIFISYHYHCISGQGVCLESESDEQCEERVASVTGAQLNYQEVAYVNNPHTCGPPGQVHLVFATMRRLYWIKSIGAAFDYMGPTWRDGVRTAAYRHG